MHDVDLKPVFEGHIDRLSREYGAALEGAGLDGLVIHSGRSAPQSRFDDQHWPHKPTPFFLHWIPLFEADAFAIIRPGQRPAVERTVHEDYWHSSPDDRPRHTESALSEGRGGIDSVRPVLKGRFAFIGEDDSVAESLNIEGDNVNPPELIASLEDIRALKTEYERICIARANAIAARGHRALEQAFKSADHTELELHLTYLRATDQDATDTPYTNIVALGENAAVLHHNRYARENTGASSLLVDAGATFHGFASDITRTYCKGNGVAAETFGRLVGAIDGMQQRLCAELKPGIEYEDLHELSHHQLATILADLAMINTSPEEMVESGATRLLFPHGLGHSLGLQVHDVGCKRNKPREQNAHLRTTATVTRGHVFTIEPGCYFIPSLVAELRESSVADRVDWNLLDNLRPFGGIRIEDNVAVTEAGSVNLTRDNWTTSP